MLIQEVVAFVVEVVVVLIQEAVAFVVEEMVVLIQEVVAFVVEVVVVLIHEVVAFVVEEMVVLIQEVVAVKVWVLKVACPLVLLLLVSVQFPWIGVPHQILVLLLTAGLESSVLSCVSKAVLVCW